MKMLAIACVAAFLIPSQDVPKTAAKPPAVEAPKVATAPDIPEIVALKGRNALLTVNGANDRREAAKQAYLLAASQAQIAMTEATAVMAKLDADFEKAYPGYQIDWQAMKAVAKKAGK